jgi:hypothetical protein
MGVMHLHPSCGELSEALLVAAARQGDRRSLAELLERHRPLLPALCRRTLGDEAAAEDVAQDACLAAMLGIGGLGRPERFGAREGVAAGTIRARKHARKALDTGERRPQDQEGGLRAGTDTGRWASVLRRERSCAHPCEPCFGVACGHREARRCSSAA